MERPMSQSFATDIVILGSGPAGYTAAIYAARAGRRPILVTGLQSGGQLTTTTEVENYPGFADPIDGTWLVEQMQAQAERVGARIVFDHVVEVDASQRPFRLSGDSGNTYECEALIYATGAQAKWLDLPSVEHYRGFGVSACATCDGFFFRDREVAVIGGGNTAVEEALYLANIASRVTLVHRRDSFRAEQVLVDRLKANPKIVLKTNAVVAEVVGTEDPTSVTGITIADVATGVLESIPVDGVFIAIGHSPASGLIRDQVALHADGYVKTRPGSTQTSVPGLFAAGDVADRDFRQAVTAAGFGCMAALEADRFLQSAATEKPPALAIDAA